MEEEIADLQNRLKVMDEIAYKLQQSDVLIEVLNSSILGYHAATLNGKYKYYWLCIEYYLVPAYAIHILIFKKRAKHNGDLLTLIYITWAHIILLIEPMSKSQTIDVSALPTIK